MQRLVLTQGHLPMVGNLALARSRKDCVTMTQVRDQIDSIKIAGNVPLKDVWFLLLCLDTFCKMEVFQILY